MPSFIEQTAVAIPTLNAASSWNQLRDGIKAQGLTRHQILVIDSSSDDETFSLAQKEGFQAIRIPRENFSHGGTRQMATKLLEKFPLLVFMTQDAIPCSTDSINKLISSFNDPLIGAAYGRQLPRQNATPIEAHARLFNYPERSEISAFASRHTKGFKSIFISNSFAAYRQNALQSVNGFPDDVIFGEDTIVAARLLRKGWLISYVAEAQVTHSHSYSLVQEFRRYFDIGVMHSRENSLIADFGGASGEGRKFVLSEIKYLLSRSPYLIPSSLMRNLLKFAGYRLGRNEALLAMGWKKNLSMHKAYWTRPTQTTATTANHA